MSSNHTPQTSIVDAVFDAGLGYADAALSRIERALVVTSAKLATAATRLDVVRERLAADPPKTTA